MIKRILVPLDPSPFTDSALEVATMIARTNDAEITGLVVLDIPGIKKSIGPIPLGGLYYAEKIEKSKVNDAEERITQLLKNFKEKCENSRVKYKEAKSQGSPSECILDQSIYYDAVVIGLRTHFHFETQDKPGDSLDELLDETITPVYGVPEKLDIPNIPEEKIKVLIPFDGSFPAARAMQRFAQLANPDLFKITLVTSEETRVNANYYLDESEAFLNAHGFTNIRKEWTTESIISAIENKYLNWANLVVVGAHSKRGVFDFMVGSLTKYLIKEAKIPILIGQ
jgi:nucleotide-binding universal stress UspA family protein